MKLEGWVQKDWLRYAGIRNANGVCWEVCRRWIKARLTGDWEARDTLQEMGNDMESVYGVHVQRRDLDVDENRNVAGLDRGGSTHRTNGWLSFKGLRSRDDVINHVLSVPGAYIFLFAQAKGKGDKGHAIALDSSRAGITNFAAFDPNFGEYTAEGPTENVRGWWKELWKVYKGEKIYHSGSRELVRYELPGASDL